MLAHHQSGAPLTQSVKSRQRHAETQHLLGSASASLARYSFWSAVVRMTSLPVRTMRAKLGTYGRRDQHFVRFA